MDFDYDPMKSAANKAKHGIDFEAAQILWTDPRLLEAPARTDDEPRFFIIGKIDGKHWSAVCIRRGDKIRLISVRRVRQQEIDIMKAREFDRQFDAGKDMSDDVEWSQARRPNVAPKRVNVDFPAWVVTGLDREAERLGVTRQALIKLWIAERLEAE